ncbi:MAG: hypothetical protein Q9P01_07445 [Anaerolineae bacterium]|nr:hypothetical protein [Anaerolineae bacterium]
MSNRRVGKPSKKHDNKLEGTHHRGDDDAWILHRFWHTCLMNMDKNF